MDIMTDKQSCTQKLPRSEDQQWHLDRRVPIALIVAMSIYGVGFVWSYATLTNRMAVVEKWIDDNRQIQSRLERLETQGEFIQRALVRIEAKIDGEKP